MAFSLSNVFNKAQSDRVVFQDSNELPFALATEAFLRYLYTKTEDKPLSVPQKLVIDLTIQSFQKSDYRSKVVPRLPHIIPKLLKSLRDPNSSAKQYVEIINKDPVMTTAVLKLANSVYFNPISRRINEIEQAIVKLGLDGLRSVLSAAVMQPIIQKDSVYFSKSGQRIWQHSLCCAVACELIAEHRGIEKFKPYVLGLIHDIGKITIFAELCKQYKLNKEDIYPGYNAFAPPIKKLSTLLSYWIAKEWEMPQEICSALEDQTNLVEGKEISLYGNILAQANYVTEIYATIYPSKPNRAKKALVNIDLPENLFDSLNQLENEI